MEVVGHDTADLGDIPFADTTESFDQCDHFGVAGEAIENVFAAALGFDEARPPEDLQVARRVGELRCARADSSSTLRTPWARCSSSSSRWAMAERLSHFGQALIDRLFRSGA